MSKHFSVYAIWLLILSSCIDPDVRRLQTNQAVEGEELYLISKALDENLYFAFQTFFSYTDSIRVANLPGCPSVTLEDSEQEVLLSFASGTCNGSPIMRRGGIRLQYQKSPINNRDLVLISYEDYQTGEASISGLRVLSLVESSRESRTWEDNALNLEIIYPSKSRAKLDVSFHHIVAQNYLTGISGFRSTGQLQGRNQTGRKVEMQISQTKQFQGTCLTQNLHRPVSGSESWTIERTTSNAVQHRLNFQQVQDCQTHTLIQLDEGVEMQKTP
ncbi:hypothetical protein [Pleomorphovibrio marinus]|uniref:hypothetical protein n=1 Tax=Pleomorphovibrio marinus TaxID=2164132 RepID=UPI0013006DBA|nr:hypothetical protein [Pleomorphovibrio marinus]